MHSITVPIEVSARHAHLTEEHCKILFGHLLTELRPVSQTGQFAAVETVRLEVERRTSNVERNGVVARRFIDNVRIIGPARKASQVELAVSDCRVLGLKNVPLRVSGSLAGTAGIMVVGPKGTVVLERGVIVVRRHIHCPTDKAKKFGFKHGQMVKVAVKGPRSVVFERVVIRVRDDFVWRMQIDTDEANAAGIAHGAIGTIVG